jgi:hypothetical protein
VNGFSAGSRRLAMRVADATGLTSSGAWTRSASATARSAGLLGERRRHTSPMVRAGSGGANGRYSISALVAGPPALTASAGMTRRRERISLHRGPVPIPTASNQHWRMDSRPTRRLTAVSGPETVEKRGNLTRYSSIPRRGLLRRVRMMSRMLVEAIIENSRRHYEKVRRRSRRASRLRRSRRTSRS